MKLNIKNIGSGEPRIAIVGCVHGDEVIGRKVIAELKKIKLAKGSLSFIIANEPAIKAKKRELKTDLNRSFPGRKGARYEAGLAYRLHQQLKKFDYVIDIHATSSSFDSLAVITKLDKATQKLLACVPIKKVAYIGKKVFGGQEMITQYRRAIALEYGPNKSGKNYRRALADVRQLLVNLDVVAGQRKIIKVRDLYTVSGVYKVPVGFRQAKELADFHLVRKSQHIGRVKKQIIKAKKEFYPIFLGKGRYHGTLSLMAKKNKIKLK